MQLLRVCYLVFFVGYSLGLCLGATLHACFAPEVIKKSNRSCGSYRVHASLFTKRLRELVKKHVGTLCIAEVVFHMLSKCFSAVFFKVNFTYIRNFPLECAFTLATWKEMT